MDNSIWHGGISQKQSRFSRSHPRTLSPHTDKSSLTPIKETEEFKIKKEVLSREFSKADTNQDGFVSFLELKTFLDLSCLQ